MPSTLPAPHLPLRKPHATEAHLGPPTHCLHDLAQVRDLAPVLAVPFDRQEVIWLDVRMDEAEVGVQMQHAREQLAEDGPDLGRSQGGRRGGR